MLTASPPHCPPHANVTTRYGPNPPGQNIIQASSLLNSVAQVQSSRNAGRGVSIVEQG